LSYYSLSNLDIKMKFIEHEFDISNNWKLEIFNRIEFFANNRANKYISHHMFDDIRQEARLGIWKAIQSFDYRKNFDFYRWAQWNISREIRRILLEDKRDKKNKKSFGGNKTHLSIDNYVDMLTVDKLLRIVESSFSIKEQTIFINNIVEGMTLSDTGGIIGLTAERVRQIKIDILSKLELIIKRV
jgi:RNA polymerase sigma factor (sigma-70 family)